MKKITNKKFINISRLFQSLRAKSDISQMELSRKLGFKNGQFISNIERAKCSIPYSIIPQVAIVLSTEQETIFKAILDDTRLSLEAACEESAVSDADKPERSLFMGSSKGIAPIKLTFRDFL